MKSGLYITASDDQLSSVAGMRSSKALPKAKVIEVAQSCPILCDPMDHQAPPSMGFSRQEYWSGLPFPSPGDLLNPRIEPRPPALQADALTSEPPGKPQLAPKEGHGNCFVVCCWSDPL